MRVTRWLACGLVLILIIGSLCALTGCGEKEKTSDDIEAGREKALSQQDEMKALAGKMKAQGASKAETGD